MDIIDLSRFIGNFDTAKVVEFLDAVPVSSWSEFEDRQKNFEAHSATKTLPGIFPDRKHFPQLTLQTYTHTDELSALCSNVCDAFCRYYNASFSVTTAVIVMMPPNSDVLEHSDTHPYFGYTHRVHWCLDADYENMDFMICGEKIPMRKGDFIEINNRMPHSVAYRGDVPRYNLIIDFLPNP